MKSRLLGRARLLSFIFILAAALLIVRLYFVQIVHGGEYQKRAMGQYVESEPDTGTRGDILFSKRDGTPVSGAVMQSGWRVAITPADITDPNSAYAALSAATTIDAERFYASVAKRGDPYEEVAFRVDDASASKIRAAKIPGVLLVGDQWRNYPAGDLAAHVVGFVGYQGDRKTGVYGLERFWQNTLAQDSSGISINPFAEIFANVGAALSPDPTAHQGSVITSIEPNVQRELQETLALVMQQYSTKSAGGIIMNPATGEIVAMAERPTFDPNTYNTVDDVSVFRNPLVENVYEMGSIMKPLTVAAGIDAGTITPQTTYHDAGCIERSGKKICNYDGRARNTVNMQEVLNQSLNLGVTFIVDKMGHTNFEQYVRAYGLGEKTKIDLPNEATSIIDAIDNGYDVDYASASFGQGIAVTPIAMIRSLSSLANGGVLPSPHVVTAIKFPSGVTRSVDVPIGPRVLKEESARTVTEMLVKVFDTALLKGELKQEHYSIAAKTGTAQIAIPGGGGYYPDRYLHSFFGYLPAHDPQFIVLLYALEPHGAEFASATLARPFLDIAKYLINYYEVPPDR
jgi:cell division protein FtsI/penicillin-binding protein 2